MCLKNFKPNTPAQRGRVSLDLGFLKISPERKRFLKPILKFLREGSASKAGRNHSGKITVRHRGGGHKRRYLRVLFSHGTLRLLLEKYFNKRPFIANLEEFIYDPNRNTSAALFSIALPDTFQGGVNFSRETKKAGVYYNLLDNSLWFACINTKGLTKGAKLDISEARSSANSSFRIGEAHLIENLPLGSFIHSIEGRKGQGSKFARAAGTYGQVIEISKETSRVRIRLPSGNERWVLFGSFACVGTVAHEELKLVCIAKAGRNRWLGKRPSVRGVAMNPVDHPHGGGEGRTSGGRPSVTPWGRPTRNWRSSSIRKKRNPFIVLVKTQKKHSKKFKSTYSLEVYSTFFEKRENSFKRLY